MKKTKLKITKWDSAASLKTRDDMLAYLEAAFDDGDPALIAAAIGDVARAEGMTKVASEASLGRESLYKSLSLNGNPEFATVIKVLATLNLKLQAVPANETK
jgi:probable addiction module antidote protein